MFDNHGPVHAAFLQREFYEDFGAGLDEAFRERLKGATREISPVDAVVSGMETTYAALTELDLDPAVRSAALASLGAVATAVAAGQFHAKGERAWALVAWAAHELNPIEGMDPPAAPDVDVAYTFLQSTPEPKSA